MCAMLGLLGMGLSMIGSIAGGMAKKADAELQAENARNNAKIAETTAQTNTLLAELPRVAAKMDVEKIKDALRTTIGAETAAYSTANLDPSSGAPLLVAGITAAQGQVDVGLVTAQGELSRAAKLADAASGFAQAASQDYQVVSSENQAKNAMIAGFLGAGSALVSGLQSSGFTGFGGSSASAGVPSIAPPIASPISSSAYAAGSFSPYSPGNRDYRGQ